MPRPNTRARRQTFAPPMQEQNKAVEPVGPNIGYTRTEVSDLIRKWELVEDCLRGEDAMKARGDRYLPRPNATDLSEQNLARYDSYLARAVFYNVAKKTVDGLVGQVFSRDPITKIPDDMKSMIDNVDGDGVSLDQQSKKGLTYVIAYGSFGIFVDYPVTSGVITMADRKAGLIYPTITQYHRRSIINWRFKKVGAVNKLSLLVICEDGISDDDGFEITTERQWRVLRLDDLNEYTQTVWIYDQDSKTYVIKKDTVKPTDGKGNPLDEIPFYFCGMFNNNAAPDEPSLYDLCVLNRSHYRNSADYEDSCYLVGQPTPVFAGLTKQWVADVFKNKPIQLGSRGSVALPVGGTATFLQAAPNSMPKEAMDQKEQQMIAFGAKLLTPGGGKNTLGEAQQEEGNENSALSAAAKNVSACYVRALKMAARMHNVSEEPEYSLNTDFPASRLTPNERTQLVMEWQAGAITTSEMRAGMRKAGVATLDIEEYKADIVANPPLAEREMQNNQNKGGSDNDPKKNKDEKNNGGNQSKV